MKRHAFHLAESLRQGGDEATVIAPLSRGSDGAGLRGFGGVVNVPANGAANYLALLTPPMEVRRFFRASDFDVVHIHEPLVPMLPYYALWFSPRAAHVCTFHMYVERPGLVARTLRHAAAAALLRGFERGIAVSAPAAELAAPSWGRPLSVIANGVPTRTFTPSARPARAPTAEDPLRLLFVGHWRDPRKGLPILLAACDNLRAQGLPIRLDVVGAGDAPASRPAVTFHGPVAAEAELADHYRGCDIFVAPATGQESFGIVLLEAMACGRPIVCSDIPGYRQVADASGARFVPPGRPEPLAAAIRELALRPELRRTMGAQNRLRSAEYDWDRLACRVREEYVTALAIRRGTRSRS